MIDIEKEKPITFSQAAKLYPNRRGGYGVNPATPWRHATKGIRKILLESWMFGGTRMTTREAVLRFFAAVTAAANGSYLATETDSAADEEAERFLKSKGV